MLAHRLSNETVLGIIMIFGTTETYARSEVLYLSSHSISLGKVPSMNRSSESRIFLKSGKSFFSFLVKTGAVDSECVKPDISVTAVLFRPEGSNSQRTIPTATSKPRQSNAFPLIPCRQTATVLFITTPTASFTLVFNISRPLFVLSAFKSSIIVPR